MHCPNYTIDANKQSYTREEVRGKMSAGDFSTSVIENLDKKIKSGKVDGIKNLKLPNSESESL